MSGHAFDVLRTGVKVDTKRFGGHMPSKATRETAVSPARIRLGES